MPVCPEQNHQSGSRATREVRSGVTPPAPREGHPVGALELPLPGHLQFGRSLHADTNKKGGLARPKNQANKNTQKGDRIAQNCAHNTAKTKALMLRPQAWISDVLTGRPSFRLFLAASAITMAARPSQPDAGTGVSLTTESTNAIVSFM